MIDMRCHNVGYAVSPSVDIGANFSIPAQRDCIEWLKEILSFHAWVQIASRFCFCYHISINGRTLTIYCGPENIPLITIFGSSA